jgi:hypothetical protein
LWHKADTPLTPISVRFWRNCAAKLFSRPKRATLIQGTVRADSIIALSQCGEEFCNTIGGKADFARQLLATVLNSCVSQTEKAATFSPSISNPVLEKASVGKIRPPGLSAKRFIRDGWARRP